MTKKVCVAIFSVFLSLAVSSALCLAAGMNAQEGEWENTMEMKMEGLSFAIPPVTMKHCVTKENLVPKASEKDEKCKIKDQKIVGNKVTWSVECVDKDGKSESQGEITYSGDSYKGTMKTRMTDKTGKTMVTTANMTGRRIGECTDKSKRTVSVGGREVQQMDPAQAERMRAQGEKALAESEKQQKEQKARWEEISRLPVPAEDPGSCPLGGQNFQDSNCESKVGKLNLKPGEWEITTQEGVDQMGHPMVGDPKRTTQCLTHESPMVSAVQKSPETKAARSSQKITWSFNKTDRLKIDERGGIVYRGDTLEGVVLRNEEYSGAGKIVHRTKISGHRIGDGTCLAQGRDFTSKGRDYSAKKRKTTPGAPSELPNPAKELRKLFRF
jgi:hypothetical protein